MTMTTLVPEQLLTVEEIAERLRVHSETVRQWLRDGRLKGFRPGGKRAGWRVTEADLEGFLDERRREATDSE